MAIEDYVDFAYLDEDADLGALCKYCGADCLEWEEARGPHNEKRWVLMNPNGTIHSCRSPVPRATVDDFPPC